jgi:hypothetical protein
MTRDHREFWILFSGDPLKDADTKHRLVAGYKFEANDPGEEIIHVVEHAAYLDAVEKLKVAEELLERCRDRMDDSDESDELWCAVNDALAKVE